LKGFASVEATPDYDRPSEHVERIVVAKVKSAMPDALVVTVSEAVKLIDRVPDKAERFAHGSSLGMQVVPALNGIEKNRYGASNHGPQIDVGRTITQSNSSAAIFRTIFSKRTLLAP
jgi:hypothetical protein